MNTSRNAAIPFDHAIAEMAAFPLASEAALKCAITGLDTSVSGETAILWREAERSALRGFPAFSVDEAVALRDKTWFEGGFDGKIPLCDYLKRLATSFLEFRGSRVIPKLPEESLSNPGFGEGSCLSGPCVPGSAQVKARRLWRWLSFALPPDLLLAALPNSNNVMAGIDLVSPTLKKILQDKKYAEMHLHVGSAIEFSMLWIGTLRAIADPGFREDAFHSPGAELDEGAEFASWLIRSAIARYILAAYLSNGDSQRGGITAFIVEKVFRRISEVAGATAISVLGVALTDLTHGTLSHSGPSFASMQLLYRQMTGIPCSIPMAKTLDEVNKADPIEEFVGSKPNPEIRFIGKSIGYLTSESTDRDFSVLFWQSTRVRALYYRHVVQRPMTPGLQWFVRFYSRMRPARRPIVARLPALNGYRDLQVESAATVCGLHEGLASLEIRTSPNADISTLSQYISNVDNTFLQLSEENFLKKTGASTPHDPKEFGVVLHFTKDRGGNARKGKPTAHFIFSNADPGFSADGYPAEPFGNPTGYRFAYFFNRRMEEARSLAWVLNHFPVSLEVIRGIDVATDELGVPTWVIKPLFEYVRKAGFNAAQSLTKHLGLDVQPLHTTAHVGEDFIHLLTGLRHVDEAIERLDLREGDRIGHGVALGVDPRDWCQRAGRIPIAREDRLFDLVWELSWYGREHGDASHGRLQLIQREIARLSEKVFGSAISPFDIELFVERLYNEQWLMSVARFPNGPIPEYSLSEEQHQGNLFLRYLTDRSVFINGKQTEWVDPSSEAEFLIQLQAWVRKKLGERGISVEVNPSSNLLIADLGDLTKHPLWRLNPPKTQDVGAPPVCVCIGTDNPLTFATNLPQEYQLVHDALLLAGLSEEQARKWVDRVRTTGLENRFTVPRTPGLTMTSIVEF